jgi:hypothetical protein
MLAALPLLAAGSENSRFAGRVFDNNGAKEIANAIVTVTTPSGYISSVTTNKHGDFAFNSLPDGEYDFRVTAHGFAIYERQITVANDLGVRTLDIRLKVPVDRQTISVLELKRPDNARAVMGGY